MTDDELEDRKRRVRAWMEFAKPQERSVNEIYLQVDDRYERIVSIAGDVITTMVDGDLHQHPVKGAEVVRWDQLPDEASNLAWMPSIKTGEDDD